MNVAIGIPSSAAKAAARRKRETPVPPAPVRVRFERFELDEQNALLLRGGNAVMLAPRPFGVLCALARRPGRLQTKNSLLDDVWGHQFVSDSVLKTAVSELRTALEDDAREPRFIETVSRRGYRFIASTSAVQDDPREAGQLARAAGVDATTSLCGCPLPLPAYATDDEILYAHELKQRLRASYLGRRAQEA